MAKSLWGDLSDIEKVRTPAGILREQASLLTEATNGVLTGAVRIIPTNSDSILNELAIKVSALGNYTYIVVTAEHEADAIYPVTIWSRAVERTTSCSSPEQFEIALEKVLTSPSIKNVISQLLSQVNDLPPNEIPF